MGVGSSGIFDENVDAVAMVAKSNSLFAATNSFGIFRSLNGGNSGYPRIVEFRAPAQVFR
jgi:hypothetical protein